MTAIQQLLEKILDLPHATLIFYLSLAVAIVGYATGELSLLQAFAAAGGGTVAGAGLGVARNGSGRGVKRGRK